MSAHNTTMCEGVVLQHALSEMYLIYFQLEINKIDLKEKNLKTTLIAFFS